MGARMSRKATVLGLVIAGLASWTSPAAAADWPAYRHDVARTACTAEQLGPTLHLQWTHASPHEPCPAWPDPVREVNLMAFDKAFQPVAAGGMVYYGSSADHQVYALDLATGQVRWRFATDAPVRFAPQFESGKLYVASDDGCAYCLAAADGKLLWKFRGGPADQRLMGNEAMISRWPLRGGLVVEGGKVYFTAGIWPTEGVYAYGLKADDGSVVWKTEAPGNFAPQGYMAAAGKTLVAPVGRADAKLIDCTAGKIRDGKGMSQAIVKGEAYLTGPFTHGANESLPVRGGPPYGERARQMILWRLDGKNPRHLPAFPGKEVAAVSDELIFLAGQGKIAAHGLADKQRKWEVDFPRVCSLAVAGRTLVVGGASEVAMLETSSGRKLWSAPVEGEVHGLAVADGRLVASTSKGRIACFGPEKAGAVGATAAASPAAAPQQVAKAEQILKQSGVTAGLCLLVGAGDGQLAQALAARSELRIYCAEPDANTAAAARKLLQEAKLYGARVTVHHIDSKTLPYPDYFADLIVVDEPANGPLPYSPAELRRVLRPCGGTAYLVSATGKNVRLEGPEFQETRLADNTVKIVRGKLPGSSDWTHLYADPGNSASSGDQLVRWPLRVLWFGKPGPGTAMNRHWRATAPLCIAGRMFILGQHNVMAVDAYNGRQLWSRDLPSIGRRVVDILGGSMVGDAQGIYVATGDMALRLDGRTGELQQVHRIPVARPRFALSSPQTFELGSLGKVEVCNNPEALVLKLTTTDATVTNADRAAAPTAGDSWELFFDFRPRSQRTGLYGPGAFQAIVVPATKEQASATCHSGAWSTPPRIEASGTPDAKGSQTTVRIAWAEIEKLVGRKPADFTFGAILNSSDNGRQLTRRTFRFANDASYRLANCWATLVADAREADAAPAGQELNAPGPVESLVWGNLTLDGDVVLGTMVATKEAPLVLARGRDFASEGHDYTGPTMEQVLGFIGVEAEAKCLFALDKGDGRLRWSYQPVGVIPHNGIAVGGGRVYVLDKSGPVKAEPRQHKVPAGRQQKTTLQVLDLKSGQRLWQVEEGLDGHAELRLGHGVLLATNMRGLTALDAANGKKLWSLATVQPMHHCSAFLRAPVITGQWVYDEPRAYDLHTGAVRNDAAGKPWQWGNFRGCGTVSGSEHMLFFRTGTPALLDVAGGTGPYAFAGIRPGCYINMIAAGGLLLMPEASSGCGCAFNFQTTVVMMHDEGKKR